jgi:hypothetical protein
MTVQDIGRHCKNRTGYYRVRFLKKLLAATGQLALLRFYFSGTAQAVREFNETAASQPIGGARHSPQNFQLFYRPNSFPRNDLRLKITDPKRFSLKLGHPIC